MNKIQIQEVIGFCQTLPHKMKHHDWKKAFHFYTRRSVFLLLGLWSVTGSMHLPVFQSLSFYKFCKQTYPNASDTFCASQEVKSDQVVHTLSNDLMLWGSVCICVAGIVASSFIGRYGDKYSRKYSLVFPFIGLFLSDLVNLYQVSNDDTSPYLYCLSEFIFGCFGGYMAILSAAFAYTTCAIKTDSIARSQAMGLQEGFMGAGSIIGALLITRMTTFSYVQSVIFFMAIHGICLFLVMILEDFPPSVVTSDDRKHRMGVSFIFSDSCDFNVSLLFIAFGLSYFSFIGATHILFFYTKQRWGWNTDGFGHYKAACLSASTVMALIVYPIMKKFQWRDTTLAIIGLISRSLSRAWMAIAWSPSTAYISVAFEAFSRYPASAIRSLVSSLVNEQESGSAFAFIGALEGFTNLSSSLLFHKLFPLSISSYPEISFIIMSVMLIPPIILLTIYRNSIDSPSDVIDGSIENGECSTVNNGEAATLLNRTLTDSDGFEETAEKISSDPQTSKMNTTGDESKLNNDEKELIGEKTDEVVENESH